MTEKDWSASPLGPIESWSPALFQSVCVALSSEVQVCMFWGPDYCALYNDAYAPTIGEKHPAALGRPARETWTELWDDLEPLLDGVRDTGQTFAAQDRPFYIERHGYGEEVYFDVSYSPAPESDGRFGGVFCICNETTERVLAERALKAETEALEILNRTAAQVAAELDLERLVQTVTDAGVALTGAEFGAFFYNVVDESEESYMLYSLSGVDRSHFDKFPMPRNTHVFAPTFVGEGVVRSDDITKDPRYGKNDPYYGKPKGHLPVTSYLAAPVISRSGEVIGGLFFGHAEAGVFDERAERLIVGLAAQAAIGIDNARLFRAQQRLNATLEQKVSERTQERDRTWKVSQDLLAVADLETGQLKSVNPSWTRLLGWSAEQLTAHDLRWLHPEHGDEVRQALARLKGGEAVVHVEGMARTAAGGRRRICWTCVRVEDQVYCSGQDVTDQHAQAEALKETEAQLRQVQKMEAIGQLTGGLAHDFNNLLQIVIGNLDMMGRRLDGPGREKLGRYVDHALAGARRAATLTQRLLAFARRQPLDPKLLDVNRLAADMSELLHRTLGETVELESLLEPRLWAVEADPNQLETAILNLALNARDAMPEGGRLTLSTANVELEAGGEGETAGPHVMIAVSDTGQGMAPEVLARAIDPFFTTKGVGKGTGLGLSMVYGFVRQSGGRLAIEAEAGQGATVRIYLPRADGEAAAAPPETAVRAPRGREETVLVCEDDDDVRAYTVDVLRELGYRVLEAHDGPAALRLLERQGGTVDLLFTDVVLPGMTGAEVAEAAQAQQPDLKVLFTTGYARDAIVHGGRLDPGVALITKPFTYQDLAARVRDKLDG
ncbi:response regulator [Brevundimonas sp. 2R-24]|uniref:histidine kinase n=1 Tax=Peiella sedimenti TaxID=3061083 RepID=A0ABT8SJZ8_9CAUL|nr:response regulator [Caulobacteraceae bacterium XZ-24]